MCIPRYNFKKSKSHLFFRPPSPSNYPDRRELLPSHFFHLTWTYDSCSYQLKQLASSDEKIQGLIPIRIGSRSSYLVCDLDP